MRYIDRKRFSRFWIVYYNIVTRNSIAWKYGRKTQISFNLQKFVEKHCNGRCESTTKHENKASYNTDYIVPDLIDFPDDYWKEIKMQIEKRSIHNCKKYCTD